MTQTKFSISAASRIVGVSRPTISRHIKSKPISFETNDLGHKLIDRSELMRVYGDRCKFDLEEKRGQTPTTESSELERQPISSQVATLQQQLTERYVNEIEHLKEALANALDYQNSVVKLLEDRSKTDEQKWQSSLDAASRRIANETKDQITALKASHDQEILKLRRALHREATKSWWDKLFEKRRVGTGNRK